MNVNKKSYTKRRKQKYKIEYNNNTTKKTPSTRKTSSTKKQKQEAIRAGELFESNQRAIRDTNHNALRAGGRTRFGNNKYHHMANFLIGTISHAYKELERAERNAILAKIKAEAKAEAERA